MKSLLMVAIDKNFLNVNKITFQKLSFEEGSLITYIVAKLRISFISIHQWIFKASFTNLNKIGS
jgi:hypothetical protein